MGSYGYNFMWLYILPYLNLLFIDCHEGNSKETSEPEKIIAFHFLFLFLFPSMVDVDSYTCSMTLFSFLGHKRNSLLCFFLWGWSLVLVGEDYSCHNLLEGLPYVQKRLKKYFLDGEVAHKRKRRILVCPVSSSSSSYSFSVITFINALSSY